MSKILILDPLQHFPASREILLEGDGVSTLVYATFFSQNEITPHSLYSSVEEFKTKYSFNPQDMSIIRASGQLFDLVYIVYPAFFFWFDKQNNDQNIDLFERVLSIAKKLGNNDTKYILIDNHDYPHDPTLHSIVQSFGFAKIFKREMRNNYVYHKLVEPFPFVIFGHLDPIHFFLNRDTKKPIARLNKIFWAGSPLIHDDSSANIFADRQSILNEILTQDFPYFTMLKHNVEFRTYLAKMRRYHYFLDLVGVGQLTKRFFEGLALGCIPLMQQNNLRFPPEFKELETFLHSLQWGNVTELDSLFRGLSNKTKRKAIHEKLNLLISEINTSNLAKILLKDLR